MAPDTTVNKIAGFTMEPVILTIGRPEFEGGLRTEILKAIFGDDMGSALNIHPP